MFGAWFHLDSFFCLFVCLFVEKVKFHFETYHLWCHSSGFFFCRLTASLGNGQLTLFCKQTPASGMVKNDKVSGTCLFQICMNDRH